VIETSCQQGRPVSQKQTGLAVHKHSRVLPWCAISGGCLSSVASSASAQLLQHAVVITSIPKKQLI